MDILIRQRGANDCMYCCVAMMLNKPYDWVVKRARRIWDIEPSKFDPDQAMGFALARGVFLSARRPVATVSELSMDIPAILTLPSTRKGCTHAVYYFEGMVYDPLLAIPVPLDMDVHRFSDVTMYVHHMGPMIARSTDSSLLAWPSVEWLADREAEELANA